MEASQYLRIKRSSEGDDGIIFAYLSMQRQPQTDLACEAMRAYWLPLAHRERGIKKKDLKLVGQKAIAQLRQQIEVIRLVCELGADEIPFGDLSAAPSNTAAVSSNTMQPNFTHTATSTHEEITDEDDSIEDSDTDDNPFAEGAF